MCSLYLRRVEGYSEWKNILLGGMGLDDYMYYGTFFYPDVDEVVSRSENTKKQDLGLVVSHNTHAKQLGKRKQPTRFHRPDIKSRHRHVRNTRYVYENDGLDYFLAHDERNLYRLGLVCVYMTEEEEVYVASHVESDDEYRLLKKSKQIVQYKGGYIDEDDYWDYT